MNHFDEMTALLYLEGQLDASRAQEVSAHAASCPGCRALLRALESEGVWLREALAVEEESIPARLIEAPVRSAVPWGWITTLGLSAGGAYTLWSGFIVPLRLQAAQAGFTQANLLTMLFFSGAFWKEGWDAMLKLMEFLAVATLGSLAIWLLRRHWRRFMTVALVMGAILCALTLPSPAGAAEVRHGDPNYTLPAGEEVKNDLIVYADHTWIDGEVDGDLIVFSANVTVNGHVKGDILSFTQGLRMNGLVDGNLRDCSHVLMLNGTVAKNLTAWAGEMELDEKAKVGGSIMAGSDSMVLNGQVTGDLIAFAGTIEINGLLGRNAAIRTSRLKIGPNAEIMGQTKYYCHRQPEVSPSAKLASPIEVVITRNVPDYTRPRYYWHQLLFWGASFVFGLTLLLLVPGFFLDATNSCKKIASAMGFGVLFLFATPIAAIVVCITIVGLGVGISSLLLYAIAVYGAKVFVAGWLGELLLGTSPGVGPAIGRLALGLAIIRALVMLPYAGVWIALLAVIWGLGGLVLATYRRLRPQLAAAA
jgi:cytoskeletal protein CcmA (bactofilin family)